MTNAFLFLGLVFIFWYEYSEFRARCIVSKRHAAGDKACRIMRRWHGWVVVGARDLVEVSPEAVLYRASPGVYYRYRVLSPEDGSVAAYTNSYSGALHIAGLFLNFEGTFGK